MKSKRDSLLITKPAPDDLDDDEPEEEESHSPDVDDDDNETRDSACSEYVPSDDDQSDTDIEVMSRNGSSDTNLISSSDDEEEGDRISTVKIHSILFHSISVFIHSHFESICLTPRCNSISD